MLVDQFKSMIDSIITFMYNNTDPFFGLPFLTLAVGLGVAELISDYFTKE